MNRLAGALLIDVAAGAGVAFAHWLVISRPPGQPKPTLEELEAAADEALARALSESGDRIPMISIVRPERERERERRLRRVA